MKRTPISHRKEPMLTRTPLTRKTPVRRVSAKRKAYYDSPEGQAGVAHMARVRALPCCICDWFGMDQLSHTQCHHPIHGRYSTRRAPDDTVLPICEGHHQGLRDTTKVALHQHPTKWKRLYGEDTSWLPWVAAKLG